MKYRCYNSFVLAMHLLLLPVILIWPSTATAQSVKLAVFATDSLTEENVTDCYVYINDSVFHHSLDGANVAYFVLDNARDNTYRIRVHKTHYHDKIFDLKVPKNTLDTTVHVKMNYIFSEPQLPIFFFDSASTYPDTNFNPVYTEPVLWLGKIQKANDFTVQINAYCSSGNNIQDPTLCEQRIHCVKNMLIQHGVDTSKIEVLMHQFEPYQILYPQEFDQYFHFKDILNEGFIRNLPASEKRKAMKYNSRITVTVADGRSSTKRSVPTALHGDSIPVVKTVYELAHSDAKKVMLRTNNICFQFVTLHLDTIDYQNRVFLDSIADYLLSHNDVKSVEVNIHLSLKEWYEEYSISLLLYMYEEIISYLGNKGVDTSYIVGKQCYNYYPIVDCNKLPDEEKRTCFDNDDFRLNRRVEFVITKR